MRSSVLKGPWDCPEKGVSLSNQDSQVTTWNLPHDSKAFRQGFIIPIPTVLSQLKHMISPYSIWHLCYINHKRNRSSSLWPSFQKAFLQDNALNTNHSHSKREDRQCTDLEGVCIAQRDWLFKKGLSYPSAYKENSTPSHYLSK